MQCHLHLNPFKDLKKHTPIPAPRPKKSRQKSKKPIPAPTLKKHLTIDYKILCDPWISYDHLFYAPCLAFFGHFFLQCLMVHHTFNGTFIATSNV